MYHGDIRDLCMNVVGGQSNPNAIYVKLVLNEISPLMSVRAPHVTITYCTVFADWENFYSYRFEAMKLIRGIFASEHDRVRMDLIPCNSRRTWHIDPKSEMFAMVRMLQRMCPNADELVNAEWQPHVCFQHH